MSEETRKLMNKFFRMDKLLRRLRHQGRPEHGPGPHPGPGGPRPGPGGDPNRGQGRVLRLLKLQPELSQRDLAYLLDMRPQSLGELLSKLERNAYITRTTSEDDRRVQFIRLTPEGEEAASRMEETERAEGDVFSFLTDDEKAQLDSLLDKMIAELESRLRDAGEDDEDDWLGGRGPFRMRGKREFRDMMQRMRDTGITWMDDMERRWDEEDGEDE